MKKIVLLIEYDGTNFAGWQRQYNAVTVQEELEKALGALVKNQVCVVGSGRTDAGVHARGQVAHVCVDESVKIPEDKIANAINSLLPDGIHVKGACYFKPDFHARYSVIKREYSYNVHTVESVLRSRFSTYFKYPIDFVKLCEYSSLFLGSHDFTAYSKHNPSTKSYICSVEECRWEKNGVDAFRLWIAADRFVYGMVRMIAGAMLDSARRSASINKLKKRLDEGKRINASNMAPANGLILERVYYEEELNFY
jgi:tRNA pseudouridine38-40 synthase